VKLVACVLNNKIATLPRNTFVHNRSAT